MHWNTTATESMRGLQRAALDCKSNSIQFNARLKNEKKSPLAQNRNQMQYVSLA